MSRVAPLVLAFFLVACLALTACNNGKKSPPNSTDASVTAPASQPSLYERLGGEPMIRAIVDDYVAITSTNPAVNFYRKGTPNEWKPTPDEARQVKQHMVDFFSLIAGNRSAQYQGGTLVDVHRGMHITSQQFAASLDDLRTALAKNNVPQDLQEEFMAAVDLTRKAIVEVKEQ